MKATYEAIYLPATGNNNPGKAGFETEAAAWEYAYSKLCNLCKAELARNEKEAFAPCTAEWMVDIEEQSN